jgi:hypothetical protein
MAAMEWAMNHDLQIANNSHGGYNTFNQAQVTQWRQSYNNA